MTTGLAEQLGPRARAPSVEDAIAEADAVVFAHWLDDMKDARKETVADVIDIVLTERLLKA